MNELLEELKWRGLVHQSTDEAGLSEHLASPRAIYCGFDPTADSLTIGNLVPIMVLRHYQLAGHRPVVIVGGATGLVGDPSGKETERALRTLAEIDGNIAAQKKIFEQVLDFSGDHAAVFRNNYDWMQKIGFLEALRDIGKHFSVNEMIRRDSISRRLEREQGISYTEFSYMLIQAYDFLHLYRADGVTIQTAGSDQWGNIASGVDLIRRTEGLDDGKPRAFGITAPLITRADGGKFGKTEAGAVWLSADRTSPYAFYQFWVNSADADVLRYLKIFTLLPRQEIEALEETHAAAPQQRAAHRRLAFEVTALLHGEEAAKTAEQATRALFSGDVLGLDLPTIEAAFASTPSSDHSRDDLAGDGIEVADLLPQTSLAKSKGEARRLLAGGGLSVNGEKVAADRRLTTDDLLHDRVLLLKKGKKNYHITRWS